jgi:hypothetical protein
VKRRLWMEAALPRHSASSFQRNWSLHKAPPTVRFTSLPVHHTLLSSHTHTHTHTHTHFPLSTGELHKHTYQPIAYLIVCMAYTFYFGEQIFLTSPLCRHNYHTSSLAQTKPSSSKVKHVIINLNHKCRHWFHLAA